MRKTKKKHYANLNHKDIVDNKKFWKTFTVGEKIILVECIKIINEEESNVEFLNSLFSNAVKNLQIPDFSYFNPPTERIFRPISKTILRYKTMQIYLPLKISV